MAKELKATIEDMLDSLEGGKCNVSLDAQGLKAELKRVRIQHDGNGLRFFKYGPLGEDGKPKDPDKDYFQGRVSDISPEDEATFIMTGLSWFVHAPKNIVIRVKPI